MFGKLRIGVHEKTRELLEGSRKDAASSPGYERMVDLVADLARLAAQANDSSFRLQSIPRLFALLAERRQKDQYDAFCRSIGRAHRIECELVFYELGPQAVKEHFRLVVRCFDRAKKQVNGYCLSIRITTDGREDSVRFWLDQ